uniref:Uncharacterized protein n=1 Tax=Oryza sativa subsp. japonica TaxID=39947 RepID=Q10AW7_ORYSJ|nr:hypothetical protein LOC_Os03g62220 [Oryza sativa Japonica Group]
MEWRVGGRWAEGGQRSGAQADTRQKGRAVAAGARGRSKRTTSSTAASIVGRRRGEAERRRGSEAAAGREGRWNGARAAEQPGGVGRRVLELADGRRHKTAATTVNGAATARTEGTGRNSMTRAAHRGRRRLRKG